MRFGHVQLPHDYRPQPRESYMSERQLAYFERRLIGWRVELIEQSRDTLSGLREDRRDIGDSVDESSSIEQQTFELRTRDRQRKLLTKIDAALARIRAGSYGYCELTGEPIGLARLQARPVATLSIEAQEHKEHCERIGDLDQFGAAVSARGVVSRPGSLQS